MYKSNSGFTLIELLVVVIIIVALAGMVVPKVIPVSDDAKVGIAQGSMSGIEVGLDLFRLHVGRYPTSDEGLNALIQKPARADNWKGPYLKKKPYDPWNKKFNYKYPSSRSTLTEYDIWSNGVDMQNGTDDDVWPVEGGE